MSIIRIDCPYRLYVPEISGKSKKPTMNMNNYRNWHYINNNKIKRRFKLALQSQIKALIGDKKADTLYVHYVFHPHDRKAYDTMNVASVVSKFFLDALTEYGTIKDDNYKIVVFESLETGRLFRLPVCCAYLSETPIYGRIKELDENDYS